MSIDKKAKLLSKLATCSLVVGGMAVLAPDSADAASTLEYNALGTGSEIRAQLLGVDAAREIKGEEGKCGEGKCGEGKCGEKDDDSDGDHGGDSDGSHE